MIRSSRILFCIFLLIPALVQSQDEHIKLLKEYYKSQAENQCVEVAFDPGNRVSQIILIRHGEPDLDKKGWRNRDQAEKYMHDYDSVGIKSFEFNPVCVEGLPINTIFNSPVPRASHTASLVFDDFTRLEDERFREFERKTMNFFNIKMPLKFWTTGSRILWLMGMNKKGIESPKEAKSRAKGNAEFLALEANGDQLVILVAHGLHNKFVLKYLRQMGWKKIYDQGNDYLSVKVMAREGN